MKLQTIYSVKVNGDVWGIYDNIEEAEYRADEGIIWDNIVEIYEHKAIIFSNKRIKKYQGDMQDI